MFYPHSKRSDLPVILFLFPGKASSFGLFYRLFNDRILRPESLISRIPIQDAGSGKRVHDIGYLFVMHLPANAWTDKKNHAAGRDNNCIFDRVSLFLST
jgi:hypothetical protein